MHRPSLLMLAFLILIACSQGGCSSIVMPSVHGLATDVAVLDLDSHSRGSREALPAGDADLLMAYSIGQTRFVVHRVGNDAMTSIVSEREPSGPPFVFRVQLVGDEIVDPVILPRVIGATVDAIVLPLLNGDAGAERMRRRGLPKT